MKKCPKCGTILDDSKKKCYMCGADLSTSASVSDFSSNFDKGIGSSITRGVDNVFNNGVDIDVNSEDMVPEDNNNGSFFSHNSASRDFFGGEINKLNSMSFGKDGFGKKTIFNKKDEGFKSKDELNKIENRKKENKDGKVRKISYSTNPSIPRKMKESIEKKKSDSSAQINNFNLENTQLKQEEVIRPEVVEEKVVDEVPDAFKSLNSFKDKENVERNKSFFDKKREKTIESRLKDNEKDERLSNETVNSAFALFNSDKKNTYNDDEKVEIDFFDSKTSSRESQFDLDRIKEQKKNPLEGFRARKEVSLTVKETTTMIFNLVCIAGFIGIMIFVYFKYIRVNNTEQLDGLQYKVPEYFELSRTDTHERFYTSKRQGNKCSFDVKSGVASDPNGYVENYFQYVKSLYASDPKAIPSIQEMRINGNTWKTQKIIFLPEEGKDANASSIIPRYSYTIITYNGSFYTLVFTNIDENTTCNEQLMVFMNSVAFIESNTKK